MTLNKYNTEYCNGRAEEDEEIHAGGCSNDGEFEKSVQKEKKTVQFYGFANKYSNLFGSKYKNFSEIISLPDPDHTEVKMRRILREIEEKEKWNDDHYLADTMETDHLEFIFKYTPLWMKTPVRSEYTECEKEVLQKILNSDVQSLSEDIIRLSEFQIVEILFCYAYNVRVTEGENTVESVWTISKLSSTLSWFDVFDDLKSVIIACYRRSLIYPLYRNWNLAKLVHKDVVKILKGGCLINLLEVREIFNQSPNYSILNSLYIDNLCNFCYHFLLEGSLTLAEELDKINVTKYEVNPDLPLLEIAAHLVLEEEEENIKARDSDVKKIVDKIAGIKLESTSSTSSSSSEESDNET